MEFVVGLGGASGTALLIERRAMYRNLVATFSRHLDTLQRAQATGSGQPCRARRRLDDPRKGRVALIEADPGMIGPVDVQAAQDARFGQARARVEEVETEAPFNLSVATHALSILQDPAGALRQIRGALSVGDYFVLLDLSRAIEVSDSRFAEVIESEMASEEAAMVALFSKVRESLTKTLRRDPSTLPAAASGDGTRYDADTLAKTVAAAGFEILTVESTCRGVCARIVARAI